MQRTNRTAGASIGRLAADAESLFAVVARSRPRHLVHGAIAVIGLTTISAVAVQPRPTPAAALPNTAIADLSPPLLALDVEESTPIAEPTAVPEPAPAEPEKKAPPKPFTHVVEEGETVRMLAAKYSLDPATILNANSLSDPDLITVGEELVILPTDGVLHKVSSGESVRRVADRYGVEMADILKANDLGDDPDVVQPGTRLVIPGATPLPAGQRAVAQGEDSEMQAASVGGGVSLPIDEQRVVPSTRTYEVQSGDTLRGIADTFGVDVDTILSSNGIDDPDTIKPGSELRILPVKGLEYEVKADETLADVAYKYQVDLGVLLDYNDLNDPDMIHVGAKLVVPGGKLRVEAIPAPAPVAVAPAARAQTGGGASVAAPPAPKPAAQAPARPAAAPKPAAPQNVAGRGGGSLVANAMKYVGYRYVFGGTSPAGFDCSGFVYYIHNVSGSPIGRGMWQQYNGGSHIPISALQPGDTVFFANTYMPGLSHDGIYIGGGQFVHASDERTGVTISSLGSGYWQAHYVGATRLWD
ncbi:MAG TPA: LysM peptidoglycan-binding domain-containing protein [Chloroflexota bacterium]|nr:LysM peptidoglycan-binding domain-containing protein [Chloroflexota bacterium]